MRKSIWLAATLMLAAVPAQAARVMVPDDLYSLHTVADPEMSPDGNWVAYTVEAADRKSDKAITHIWMVRYDGLRSVQLTSRDKENESHPRFSPDGRWLGFLSSRSDDKERDALWLLDRAGGEAQKVSDFKGDVQDFAWSPDGRKIALIVSDPDPAEDKDKDKTPDPIVIDRFRFLQDYVGYINKRHDHLYVFDVASRKADLLTPGEYSEGLPAWSPDGKSIAFVGKRHKNADRDNNWGLYVMAAQKGAQLRQIAERYAADVDVERPTGNDYPMWSPDGKSIAYMQTGDPRLIEYATDVLAVVPVAGGVPRILTPTLDRNVGMASWSPDGRSIAFLVEDDRAEYLASVPAGGGPLTRLVSARNVVEYYSRSGGRFALLITTPVLPSEVFAWDGTGAPRQITHSNEWLKQITLAKTEEISFRSKDGTEVHGFMLKPPGSAGGNLPTILRLHGGPQSQYQLEFDEQLQIMAGHGYAVLASNPRGSTGRGQAYCAGIFANWGGPDVQDVLASVDYAVKIGVSDPNRLAVGGWSYGGMLTNYVIASDTRFKAATSGASIADIFAGYGTDQYAYDYEKELGLPWKNTAGWMKVSYPFLHADRIKTPTLFLGGDLDLNVPLRNGMQMYEALKSLNIDTELVIYPDQYHGIEKPSYVRDRQQRYLDWYDKYLKGKHG